MPIWVMPEHKSCHIRNAHVFVNFAIRLVPSYVMYMSSLVMYVVQVMYTSNLVFVTSILLSCLVLVPVLPFFMYSLPYFCEQWLMVRLLCVSMGPKPTSVQSSLHGHFTQGRGSSISMSMLPCLAFFHHLLLCCSHCTLSCLEFHTCSCCCCFYWL